MRLPIFVFETETYEVDIFYNTDDVLLSLEIPEFESNLYVGFDFDGRPLAFPITTSTRRCFWGLFRCIDYDFDVLLASEDPDQPLFRKYLILCLESLFESRPDYRGDVAPENMPFAELRQLVIEFFAVIAV